MTRELGITRWAGNLEGADATRRALVLPGAHYPVELPGLALPMRALALQGWELWHATWTMSEAGEGEQQAMVEAAVQRLDDETAGEGTRLLLAKSVGTLAAGWAADHRMPAIWTTPLLDREDLLGHIARNPAPALLVGGGDDPAWNRELAERTGKVAVQLDGVDHGWRCGDWRREHEVLGQLTAAVDEFARSI